MSNKH